MTTLIDIRDQVKVCDEATISRIYTKITLLLKEIHREIRKHEKEFETFLIKQNPVSTITTLAITEINCLERLPEGCGKIQKHARELVGRLIEFKENVGTPLCKTAHQAYDTLANNIVNTLLKNVKRDMRMPEISLNLTGLYEDLIKDAAITQPKN